jgi:hypothetical protein
VEVPARADLERRLHAFIADFLDDLEADEPDGFDLGPMMLIVERRTPWTGEAPLRRIEGGYLPNDFSFAFRMWCTDWRWWMQRALLDEARVAFFGDEESDSNDSDEGGVSEDD